MDAILMITFGSGAAARPKPPDTKNIATVVRTTPKCFIIDAPPL
jgi:hypothetical protein